ncbi:Ankk1, partial [Symbiodinium pilosum]
VTPVHTLMGMKELKPHEELMQEGILVEYDDSKGNAMFVSHQWAGAEHPDPNFEQFTVLQDALRNAMSGTSLISGNISIELYTGQQVCVSAKDLTSKALYIWYDFFSCPQSSARAHDRQLAISSIPAYVDRCQFFVILCPHVRHAKHQLLLNKRSWESRGWCRLERVARELSTRADTGVSIEIQGATHQSQAAAFGWVQAPVGTGSFTVPSDKEKIAQVLQRMVRKKLHYYLVRGDLHSYRLMLNIQRVHYKDLHINPIEGLVPGFVSESHDPAVYAAESFMFQNGFNSINQRTAEGWTPICFAAVDGSPMLISALLEQRADVNDRMKQREPASQFGQDTPLLHMCAFLTNNEALRVLISSRADVAARDGFGATALVWAAFSNNVEGIKALWAAGCDPAAVNMLGYSPFRVASAVGRVDAMNELLPHTSKEEINLALHAAMLQGGGSAEVMSTLLRVGAEVDFKLNMPLISPLGIWFGCLSLRHRWKSSLLSSYAYHHYGATPLMCSVITGSFEATAVLLAAGARTDLRNLARCCGESWGLNRVRVPVFRLGVKVCPY